MGRLRTRGFLLDAIDYWGEAEERLVGGRYWTMERMPQKGGGEESTWYWSAREETTIFLGPGRT
jgi:hypothetical protein